MDTPRKTFNYSSPYAKPIEQYPSQSEDYISLDMGGLVQPQNVACSSNEKTPGPNNMKYYQQNCRNSSSKANRKNLFNNNFTEPNYRQSFNQQQRYRPRKSNEYQQHSARYSNEKRQHDQHQNNDPKDNSTLSYCHPSMTEDPWSALTKRLKALERSKISTEKSSPPLESNSNPSSDTEQG